MEALHNSFGSGNLNSLSLKINFKDILTGPIENDFFNFLYSHYFPGQQFNTLEFMAFVASIFAYVVCKVQGKGNDFREIISNEDYSKELINIASNLQTIIGGGPALFVLAETASFFCKIP